MGNWRKQQVQTRYWFKLATHCLLWYCRPASQRILCIIVPRMRNPLTLRMNDIHQHFSFIYFLLLHFIEPNVLRLLNSSIFYKNQSKKIKSFSEININLESTTLVSPVNNCVLIALLDKPKLNYEIKFTDKSSSVWRSSLNYLISLALPHPIQSPSFNKVGGFRRFR